MKKSIFEVPVWLWIFLIVSLAYHIFVLPISPLPWFDETYFASMGINFLENGTFEAKISPMADFYYPQSKAYGPGYFLVLSAMYKFFGFGIFQTRLPGLLFGFAILVTGFKILKLSGIKENLCSSFVLLLLFDPIFLQNIHSGRMDSMALMFTFIGILFLIKGLEKQEWLNFILVGIFFGFAILTTPRVAVSIIGPSLVLAVYFFVKPTQILFLKCISIVLIIVSLYTIWIFWGFGGPSQMYQYLFGEPRIKLAFNSVADIYIASSLYLPKFQIPALIIALLSVVYLFFKQFVFKSAILGICIISLISFYSLVNDTGIYSIFSMPFVYLIIVCALNHFPGNRIPKISRLWPINLLILLNVTIFIFKNGIILAYSSSRNYEPVQEQIAKVIPKGSRVIGEEIFYYMVHDAGSDFQYLDRGADGPNRKMYHENIYKYQYVISRNPPANVSEFNQYNVDKHYKKIHKIQMPVLPEYLISFRSLLAQYGFYFPTGYEGNIYLR